MIGKNIVIVAHDWNPTIMTSDWLNQKIKNADFKTQIMLPPLTVANSPSVKLICEPQKLQLLINNPDEGNICDLANYVEQIVEALPETKYSAVGITASSR